MTTKLFFFFLMAILHHPINAQLCLLNDEFDDASTLSNWQNINNVEGWNAEQLEVVNINATDPGHLFFNPFSCAWFGDKRGPLLFKPVNGDFVFTTEVRVTERNGNGSPSATFSLAGCMVRIPKDITHAANPGSDWIAGDENYIFLSTGFASTLCGNCFPNTGVCNHPAPHAEVKSTTNSGSCLRIFPVGSQTLTIRVARIGSVFILMYKEPDEAEFHVLPERYDRPDFPSEVQVGLVAYTDFEHIGDIPDFDHNSQIFAGAGFNPDLNAGFDFVRFNEVEVPAGLAGLNLANAEQVSDSDLLSFLGYPSVPENCSVSNPGGKYLSVWRAGDDTHAFYTGLNWADFVSQWETLADTDLRLIDVDIYRQDGTTYFNGVWRAGNNGYAFYRYKSWNKFILKMNSLASQGLRLIDIETDLVGNTRFYTGVWKAGNKKHLVYSFLNWSNFTQKWKSLANAGYRLIDVETFLQGGHRRYLGIWQKGAGGYALYRYNSWESFIQKWEELSNIGLRLIDIETYEQNGQQRYLGVWRAGKDGYALYRNESWEDFIQQWQVSSSQNLRLIDLERFE